MKKKICWHSTKWEIHGNSYAIPSINMYEGCIYYQSCLFGCVHVTHWLVYQQFDTEIHFEFLWFIIWCDPFFLNEYVHTAIDVVIYANLIHISQGSPSLPFTAPNALSWIDSIWIGACRVLRWEQTQKFWSPIERSVNLC